MLWLDITITFHDKTTIKCGEIVTKEPDKKGYIQGAFRYTPEYLEHPLSFPIDPAALPLNQKEFPTQRPEGIHAVFEDALPDDWGRKLLIQQSKLSRRKQTPPRLLGVLGPNSLGALSFAQNGEKVKKRSPANFLELPLLLETAINYDAGLPVNEEQLKMLFVHGSSPGGARPKASIRKEDNSLWLAKFPRQSDTFLVEPIEAACIEMAKRSGLPVPEFELQNVGNRKVLLVKRFDISDLGGRYHMISMQTLLQAQGYYYLGYADLFEIIKRYSFQPSVDIPILFRQMIFNIAIGNTDDHLKNFCMLHKESGFCLSPTYDLLPDIYEKREHTLSFPSGLGALAPKRKDLLNIGGKLNITQTSDIIDQVVSIVSNWENTFQNFDVPESDIQKLEWSIERRLSGLAESKTKNSQV